MIFNCNNSVYFENIVVCNEPFSGCICSKQKPVHIKILQQQPFAPILLYPLDRFLSTT